MSIDPAIPLLGIYPTDIIIYPIDMYKITCMQFLITELFEIKDRKQLKYWSIGL